ncbi:PEGA domain-containing protein [Polyangium spumosum]|uniref:PEGA domain-containing protein n=1 Tax=Polyangium spumosum TaxID=889282 RepID=A0A6N7PM23_9BACT|nr:PEGA domain-containing protein [Polyangium spumosum]MRG93202.1 PEGA domain-containing protein [Polyangium spumosum]
MSRNRLRAGLSHALLVALSTTFTFVASADAPPNPAAQAPTTTPDPAVVARAKERKAEGDKAMDRLRPLDALAAYSEAYTLNPEPALLYNMGRALEALDRLPEAIEKLTAFRAEAPAELLARVPGLNDRITSLEKRISRLTVKVNVEGARILVRDAVAGMSPLDKPLALKAGPAEVVVEAEGFFPYRTRVDLPGGGAYVLDAQLQSKAKVGKLIVTAPHTGVKVLVDGTNAGQAPLETLVAAGTHKIQARHPEFKPYETSVIVNAGGERTVALVLERPPPIYARWWFWTTIGVVVAGGAAGGAAYALTTERDPDRGDIQPGQLSPAHLVMTPPIPF